MSLRQQKISFLSHRLISFVKASYKNLLPECTKMRIFRCNFAKFSRGHSPGPPKMVVPSALPLKLIVTSHDCDETLPPPSEVFCVLHSLLAIHKPEKLFGDPKSYRLISVMCVFFEIFERLIVSNLSPMHCSRRSRRDFDRGIRP